MCLVKVEGQQAADPAELAESPRGRQGMPVRGEPPGINRARRLFSAHNSPRIQSKEPSVHGDSATVRRILTELGDTWAIVGLSSNQRRAAYGVATVLQRHGKRIVPVHPKAETVHGEQGYASLAEIPFDVDVVDVFVNSDLAGAVADEAVAKGAKAVWFQLDVIDEAACDRTRAAGLDMVMDRCPAIEIPRLP